MSGVDIIVAAVTVLHEQNLRVAFSPSVLVKYNTVGTYNFTCMTRRFVNTVMSYTQKIQTQKKVCDGSTILERGQSLTDVSCPLVMCLKLHLSPKVHIPVYIIISGDSAGNTDTVLQFVGRLQTAYVAYVE